MIPNYQIRASARRLLDGNLFSSKWLMAMVGCLIVDFVSSLTSAFYVGIIFTGFFELALAYFLLRPVRTGEEVKLEDLLKSFTHPGASTTILLGLMKTLYLVLWSLLFFIPGFVKSYSYALTGYLRFDRPDLNFSQVITESRRLMNGHKMDLFLLDLSFLGWYLLGALLCGVGVILVVPYHQLSRALFYEAILRTEQSNPYANPTAF